MFKIKYGTGAGNTTADTLDEAMSIADEGAAYTQEHISIEDAEGNVVARRFWWSCTEGIENEENPIRFGDFGFYGDWQH